MVKKTVHYADSNQEVDISLSHSLLECGHYGVLNTLVYPTPPLEIGKYRSLNSPLVVLNVVAL